MESDAELARRLQEEYDLEAVALLSVDDQPIPTASSTGFTSSSNSNYSTPTRMGRGMSATSTYPSTSTSAYPATSEAADMADDPYAAYAAYPQTASSHDGSYEHNYAPRRSMIGDSAEGDRAPPNGAASPAFKSQPSEAAASSWGTPYTSPAFKSQPSEAAESSWGTPYTSPAFKTQPSAAVASNWANPYPSPAFTSHSSAAGARAAPHPSPAFTSQSSAAGASSSRATPRPSAAFAGASAVSDFERDRAMALQVQEEEQRAASRADSDRTLALAMSELSNASVLRDRALAQTLSKQDAGVMRDRALATTLQDDAARDLINNYNGERAARRLHAQLNGEVGIGAQLAYNLAGRIVGPGNAAGDDAARAEPQVEHLAPAYRWHWQRPGDSEWQPFSAATSATLESAWLNRDATPTLTLAGDAVSTLPAQPASAVFNVATKIVRPTPAITYPIERFKSVSDIVQPAAARWSVQIDANRFIPLDPDIDHRIEQAFRAYVRGPAGAPAEIRGVVLPRLRPARAGAPAAPTYAYNFATATQRNELTGTQRALHRTREDPAAAIDHELVVELGESAVPVLEGSELLADLKEELNWMVVKAAGASGPADPVTLRLVRWPTPQLILGVTGVARTISSLLLATVLTKLRAANVPPPRAAAAAAARATANNDGANPRLTQLASPWWPIEDWHTRDDVMLLVAHALIWKADATVYGGFVRDWVVRGDHANDIDVLLSAQPQRAAVEAVLFETARLHHLEVRGPRPKGVATAYELRGAWPGGAAIDVDLVVPHASPMRPYVDTDVGNLCISAKALLAKKEPRAGEPLLPLAQCIRHCQQKQFVFFYNPDAAGAELNVVRARLRKYLGRRWTCLSPLNRDLRAELDRDFPGQIQPDPRYQRAWWA